MQDIVILPTFDRPEMLWLCLEYLSRSLHSPTVQIRVSVDAHIGQPPPARAEIAEVVDKFPELSIQTRYRTPHPYPGNSYNLLMAYRDAYESDASHVFLIEDDVLIHPDFFVWHWVTLLTADCSIAVVKEPQFGSYASLGVGFRRDTLQLILPHCIPAYFQNLRGYCQRVFPPSPLDCEQDGLWGRVLAGRQVVWSPEPRAQHVGWYGYHRTRSVRPVGTLDERFHQVKHVLSTMETLQPWVKDFHDITPLRL